MSYSMIICLSLVCLFSQVLGHGMMLEPPNRSSLWRTDRRAPINYEDNQNFCGGFQQQWEVFGGKCGLCGDKYDDPHPQANENTGKYGQLGVHRIYNASSVVDVMVELTANHVGHFTYSLCVLEDASRPEPGEECFVPLQLADGSSEYNVDPADHYVHNKVQLPEGLTCERCVLRWHYRAGNNWGFCNDGTGGMGCGPQETFRSCADISIV